MEVGEEDNTSNHVNDSVPNQNDDNLQKDVSEPNNQQEEDESSVTLPKSDESKPLLTVAVEEEPAAETEAIVPDRNSEAVMVDSNAGGLKGDDVTDTGHAGSELKDNELNAVEEDIDRNDEENVNTNVETVQPEEEEEEAITEIVEEEEQLLADEDKSVDTDLETDEEKAGTESPEQEQPVKTRGRQGRKRKRGGKAPQATPKSTGGARKTVEEEDVCFMCFDGGDLVICDKRDCPKAYHPACINRDEAFFQTKGRWNCGWHLCTNCSKKADYLCYTCTFSLCKSCIKTDVILCIRDKEKKGFCESCMKTVVSIEKNSQENQETVDFNDKNSWEYLFKDYWTDMKAKLDISLSELVEAKNPYKGSKPAGKQELPAGHSDGDSGSENPSENIESQTRKTRSRKSKKAKTRGSAASASDGTPWASKELLEFVTHMVNDASYKSQFDVQALLLEYIKTNKLRDSRRKSQIICDARLQGLFGKPRVGHFEMLKLLESHFLLKEDNDNQGSVVDTETSPIDDEKMKDKKRKNRKKGDQEPQSNREDYAAIDIHNISLIYLKRKLAEDLLDDTESFRSKSVGTFVRIRISGANHSQDIYRLVQVTGTTITGTHYAVGKTTTDIMLEILNLDKTESVSIDTISNQDFTEEECKRLRQSIKCGLIKRLTVGDILDKAIELQATRVNDWLETEVLRLSHLRDRASDLGRKKELRECVEKLEVLKTPEERARRLQDIPVIHDDPTMDPNYESEDDIKEDDKKQDTYNTPLDSRFSKRRDYPSKDSWRGSGTSTPRNPGKSYEFSRSLSSNDFSKKVEDAAISPRVGPHNDNKWGQGRDTRVVQTPPSVLKKPSLANATEKIVGSTKDDVSETEKMWHYKDPTGKIQGPFSLAQLRKWNNNKFFPVDLKIWRITEKEKDGILLTDALDGQFTVKTERHGFASLPSPTPTPNQSMGHVGPPVAPSLNGSQVVAPPSVAGQNAYGWSGGPPQSQQVNQWAVQTPVGNFMQQPPQPNVSWPAVVPNPNMGPVGLITGSQPMNWGAVNVNPAWGLQAGPVNVNPNWVPPQPIVAVTPNQGWVGGPGPIPGPGPGPGPTQAPTISNHEWGSPKPGGGGSGFDGNRRQWEKQGSFNNRGR